MGMGLSMYTELQVTGPALHAEPTTLHGAQSASAAMSPGVHSQYSTGSMLGCSVTLGYAADHTLPVWSACD